MAKKAGLLAGVATGALLLAHSASASLTPFQVVSGSLGVSTDGCGSLSQACNLTALVPAGSTVTAAYLYTSLYSNSSAPPAGGTLDGSTVNYATALGYDPTACCTLQAWRADVTSIVAPVINAGGGAPATDAATGAAGLEYTFPVTETTSRQDGEGLVVVYSNPSLPTTTVGILDGFSKSSGDAASINFATPLDPTASGFTAEMRIGDGFSYDGSYNSCSTGQVSNIHVNGKILTNVAGNFDDGAGANGALITVGAWNDPYTAVGETCTGLDHERYNLASFINKGDTSISVNTVNPSGDDNIFLEVFQVSGTGTIIVPGLPEPASLAVLGVGLAGLGLIRRRRQD